MECSQESEVSQVSQGLENFGIIYLETCPAATIFKLGLSRITNFCRTNTLKKHLGKNQDILFNIILYMNFI